MSREQKLVNAQVEVNRAVFLMNARNNSQIAEYKDIDASDEAICQHIERAICELTDARCGYLKQMELKFANNEIQRTESR